MLYDAVVDLDVVIEGYDLHRRERETSSGFTRATTIVSLHGDGESGSGEDVTYDNDAHDVLQNTSQELALAGAYELDDFSTRISALDLFFGDDPGQSAFWNYRQWAFESAALDLALKQAETTLADRLDREYHSVRFVVSTRLDDPPTGERVLDWLDRDPDLEFKLDPTSDWSADVISRLPPPTPYACSTSRGSTTAQPLTSQPIPGSTSRSSKASPTHSSKIQH